MAISKRNWERLGDMLAVIVALLLATVIVALAATTLSSPPVAAPAKQVHVALKRARPPQPVTLSDTIVAAINADDALKRLDAEEDCLAQAIYFEARNEGEAGQRAMAEVILNRLAEGSHGKTICAVVYEGVGQTLCQFSFACDGTDREPKIAGPWRAAQVLASRMIAGDVPSGAASGAAYYHAASAHSTPTPGKPRVTQIGNHIFHRDRPVQISAVFRGPVQ